MRTSSYLKSVAGLLFLAIGMPAFSQNVDIDQLLADAIQDNKNQNYDASLEKTRIGMRLAPDYLDFHVLAGRNWELKGQKDSARYYFDYVIEKNPAYAEAFSYKINMDLEDRKFEEAGATIQKALARYPGS
ncbi:MAG TPA: hypothetical protein VFR70_05420, partial [Flavobacterium sp.]|nr:hypothetical protein [Flavobacterium sp.]